MWIPEIGMALTFDEVRAPVKVWDDGAICVGDTRVSLEAVLFSSRHGASPEEIADEIYPALDLGDVYLVVGYSLAKRDEADAYLRRCEEMREQGLAMADDRPSPAELWARTRARLRAMGYGQ